MSRPIRRVAVFGGGVAGAMAALAVARAYGRLETEVSWVERTGPAFAHAGLIAPPDITAFHRLLGIDEAALAAQAGATFNLGQQFVGWSGGEAGFLHAYGDAGTAFAALPFIQHWTRARHAGLRVALEDFCVAAAAAKQGRVGTGSRQSVKHGFHLDAAGYAALLRARAIEAGVRVLDGEDAQPVASGGAAGIRLADGRPVEADLFVDAEGALIDRLDPEGLRHRPGWCDRLIRATAPPLEPLPPFSRVAAHPHGWMTLIPLRNRTAIEFPYAGSAMTEDEAGALLRGILGRSVAMHGAAPIGHGARQRPWMGNCVAIGPAAGDAPLLDGAELLLLQLAVAQLILLWPVDRDDMTEAAIYNEEMAGSRARVEDFSAQHFRLNRRTAEPFWDGARAAPISDELAAKIDLFAARGMFAHFNHEAHVEDSWALCMAGHGALPRSCDPQAAQVEDAALMAEFQRQLRVVAEDVRAMDTHEQTLQRLAAARR